MAALIWTAVSYTTTRDTTVGFPPRGFGDARFVALVAPFLPMPPPLPPVIPVVGSGAVVLDRAD